MTSIGRSLLLLLFLLLVVALFFFHVFAVAHILLAISYHVQHTYSTETVHFANNNCAPSKCQHSMLFHIIIYMHITNIINTLWSFMQKLMHTKRVSNFRRQKYGGSDILYWLPQLHQTSSTQFHHDQLLFAEFQHELWAILGCVWLATRNSQIMNKL